MKVVCEGQRMGCFSFTARLCTKNWTVPGSDFTIPKDTRVIIPIVSLYEIHIPLSFTRKIKPEYEDVDDDGGNDWQHNCQPELYMGVHLDITITLK